jgi:hypothetical protein
VISAVKGLMIFCALSFEHVFKFFFLWREFYVCEKKTKEEFLERKKGRGVCWWKKVKLVSYHVVHLDYYIG